MHSLDRRLTALENMTTVPRYFIAYPEEQHYVLPGGAVVDGDTFATHVERERGAVVIRVEHKEMHDDTDARL